MTNKGSPRLTRRDTLRGLAFTASASLPTMAALSACTPAVRQELSPYMALITHISERIIPRTDTPGAIDAGVPAYIEALVGTHYTEVERDAFKTGLTIFDTLAHEGGTKSFLTANADLQTDILTQLDTAENTVWMQLKQAVAFGYYTSEAAAQELQYDAIPGRYDGDIPLEEVGRAWLTTGI